MGSTASPSETIESDDTTGAALWEIASGSGGKIALTIWFRSAVAEGDLIDYSASQLFYPSMRRNRGISTLRATRPTLPHER